MLAEIETFSAQQRIEDAAALRSVIDLRTGEGFRQIFGGRSQVASCRLLRLDAAPSGR